MSADRLDEIEARANEDADATWEVFQRQFEAFDGYRSPAKQHDLWTVFRSGIQYADQRIDAPALVAALQAVHDLHVSVPPLPNPNTTAHVCRNCDWEYPCPTVRAIEAALGGAA